MRYSRDELFNLSTLKDSVLFTKGYREKLVGEKEIEMDFSLRDDSWGEKIPYYRLEITKSDLNISLFDYCHRWNDYFLNESRIIHIVRHPVDVSISNKNAKYTANFSTALEVWTKNVPRVLDEFEANFDNVLTVKYEDILLEPERSLGEIFTFCKL